jgi:hypothetical protein
MDEDEAYQSPVPMVYEGQRQFRCHEEAYHPLPSSLHRRPFSSQQQHGQLEPQEQHRLVEPSLHDGVQPLTASSAPHQALLHPRPNRRG